MNNVINWFEIPVTDFDRAHKFYSELMAVSSLELHEMGGMKMGFLPMESREGVGGGICLAEGYTPSQNGVLIYINGGEDLSAHLARVEPAGGKVVLPKTKISDEIGFMAIFIDSEGNKLAFHSPK
jgi:predicted enzyme related to lactoylglutathione lyase